MVDKPESLNLHKNGYEKRASVEGVNFAVTLYDYISGCYLHACDVDYGFLFESFYIKASVSDDIRARFMDDTALSLELNSDGSELTARIGNHVVKLYDNVYSTGIKIRYVLDDLKLDNIADLKSAYINLVNEYNNFRTDYIGR